MVNHIEYSVAFLSGAGMVMVLKPEMPFMTREQKISQNLKAVENAIAQQRLEGLEVPQDVVNEMNRAARGEIEIEEGIRNTVRRFTHGKVRGPRPLL
ncbi:MAG: antitoxin VbhA family protein [Pseudomonadota bacterium]